MSRGLTTTNKDQTTAASLHPVLMVKLDFDTPAYFHSGIGDIVFDSNTYTGVGDLGNISEAREQEVLSPSQLTLTLSGVNTTLIAEAQAAGRYKDAITIYEGYRQDDGTLVDDPWIVWKGWFEYASILLAQEGAISVICHHDLSVLDEKDGSRFTDEDHHKRYSADDFFKYVADQAGLKLRWGGIRLGGVRLPEPPQPGGTFIR